MQINDVILHLLLKQPFYGYIASSVTHVESNNVQTIEASLLPTPTIFYNKKWYEGLKDQYAVGVVLHGLLHLLLLHSLRRGNRERHLWTIACDMAVNEHIDISLLPDNSITVDKIMKEINEVIPKQKSAEHYYDIISKSENQISFAVKDKELTVFLKDGQQLKANNQIESDSSEINKNAVKSMMSETIEEAQSEGEIPGGISGHISEIYNMHEINWRNVLKRFLLGKGKVKIKKSFKKQSKRFEDLPGNKRVFGTDALVALDESGSISEKQLQNFYNEMVAINRITGASIIITEFDTTCTQPVRIEKYVRQKKRVKSGGTDFRPVFELADKLRIPLIIIFTDGEGTAPKGVNQRVLWVLTKGGKMPVEYGFSISFSN